LQQLNPGWRQPGDLRLGGRMSKRTKLGILLGAVIVAIFGYAFYINLV
jgi:hypothetical protein